MSGACALISTVACRPVMRGIETSSTQMSGRSRSASCTASTPSAASATTSMSGWRSSSSFSPPRTMPWSSAMQSEPSVVALMRAPRARTVSSTRRALAGLGARSPGARRPAARARACPPGPSARCCRRLGSKPSPSSVIVTRSSGLLQPSTVTFTLLGVRVAGDVRQRLLHDAVDDELLELADQRARAVGGEVRGDAPALAEQAHLRAQRRHQAVVVERRRAQLAGQAEQLLHRLVGEALGLLELLGELRAARSRPWRRAAARPPASAWLTSSCRSRATRARSASWARSTAVALPTRSCSRRESMRLKDSRRREMSADSPSCAWARTPGSVRSTASIVRVSDSSGAKRRRMTRLLASSVARIASDEHEELARARGRGRDPGARRRSRRTPCRRRAGC